MSEDNDTQKILFLIRNSPTGTIYSNEGLETALIFAAFEQELTMVFVDDGVFAIKKGQDSSSIGMKSFLKTYSVLEDYGFEQIIVDENSLKARGLKAEDLSIDVEVLPSDKIGELFKDQHAVINY